MSHRTSTRCRTYACKGKVYYESDSTPATHCVKCQRERGTRPPVRTAAQREADTAAAFGRTVEQHRARVAESAARREALKAMTPEQREAHLAARKAAREAALEAELASY